MARSGEGVGEVYNAHFPPFWGWGVLLGGWGQPKRLSAMVCVKPSRFVAHVEERERACKAKIVFPVAGDVSGSSVFVRVNAERSTVAIDLIHSFLIMRLRSVKIYSTAAILSMIL
jgi:hypothetical protein